MSIESAGEEPILEGPLPVNYQSALVMIRDRNATIADLEQRLAEAHGHARLSPAPVGGETEAGAREAGRAAAERICAKVYGNPDRRQAILAGLDRIADLEQRLAEARRRIGELEAGFKKCIEDYEDAANYKSDYLREKHGDTEQVAKYRALLSLAPTDKAEG